MTCDKYVSQHTCCTALYTMLLAALLLDQWSHPTGRFIFANLQYLPSCDLSAPCMSPAPLARNRTRQAAVCTSADAVDGDKNRDSGSQNEIWVPPRRFASTLTNEWGPPNDSRHDPWCINTVIMAALLHRAHCSASTDACSILVLG